MTVRDTDPYLSNSRVQISAPAQATLAILPISETVGLPDLVSQFGTSSDAHAPPESPPVETSSENLVGFRFPGAGIFVSPHNRIFSIWRKDGSLLCFFASIGA